MVKESLKKKNLGIFRKTPNAPPNVVSLIRASRDQELGIKITKQEKCRQSSFPYQTQVLPSNFPVNVPLGTKCSVTYRGKKSDAIYADIGPRFQLGEGSIALAKALGINADPKRGGTEEKMLYEVYLA